MRKPFGIDYWFWFFLAALAFMVAGIIVGVWAIVVFRLDFLFEALFFFLIALVLMVLALVIERYERGLDFSRTMEWARREGRLPKDE